MGISVRHRRLFWLLGAVWLAGPAAGQPIFELATDRAFPHSYRSAIGTTFGDYNNDGWPDLFLAQGRTLDTQSANLRGGGILLPNLGAGRFVEANGKLPAALDGDVLASGAIFGDYDNDGDLDLFVPTGAYWNVGRDRLLRNDRGTFRDVGIEAGFTDSLPTINAIWLDYDRDGFLDLYTGHWLDFSDYDYALDRSQLRNRLYHNQGDGTFANVTQAAGLDFSLYADTEFAHLDGGSGQGMVAADFDDDGWPDLYLSVFRAPNLLLLNDGAGGFRDAPSADLNDGDAAFGVAVGDIDNDGDLDIFQAAGGTSRLARSLLLLNQGGGQFIDFTEGLGLSPLGSLALLGAELADIDNDGDLDLMTAQPHFLFLNDGHGFFEEATARAGLGGIGLDLTFVDYDLDGFLDVSSHRGENGWGGLFRNRGNGNHYLRVELVGIESNRQGIGAKLLATAGDLSQRRDIFGGNGFTLGETVAHFGLGQRTEVERLEVHWLSGRVDVLRNIPADQKIRVFEGREEYHKVEPTAWEEAPQVLTAESEGPIDLAVRPALFEPGAEVVRVTADLSALGGPAALDLPIAEGGLQWQRTVPIADGPGVRTIVLQIEQSTSLGPYWTELIHRLTVAPAADRGVYADAAAGGWVLQARSLVNMTRTSSWSGLPSWAPDGARLIYSLLPQGLDFELYEMGRDGTGLRQLTHVSGLHIEAAWAPDGTQIAFTGGRWDGNWDIYTMDADGGNLVNLTQHPAADGRPMWSPDGTKIAFNTARDGGRPFCSGNWEIYAMRADGSASTNLTNNRATDCWPSWSPDGQRIAFGSNRSGAGEIYAMDADGDNPVQLTHRLGNDQWPSWSPDGRRLVFGSERSGNFDLYAMDADGGNIQRLTYHPAREEWPSWSPDGRYIAFSSNRRGATDVYVMDLAPGIQVALDPEQSGTVYQGGTALQVQTQAEEWQVVLEAGEGLEAAGYKGLHLAFHPGDTEAGAFMRVVVGQAHFDLLRQIDLTRRDWQVVEIPLDPDEVGQAIEAIAFIGTLQGTFFLDDVRLLTRAPEAATAVVESRHGGVPHDFGLDQNYPNPFNAGTVIRFALPTASAVELELFNLSGQQVATLVQGQRPAGAYTVRWDGRDEGGRELASGLYLYRLRAGAQVETRKLLLLR